MFLHLLKYRLKTFLKPSDEIFWAIAFPYILATLFYLAFGNIMSSSESFEPIKTAIVKEANADEYALTFLSSISASGKDQMLKAIYVTKEEADSKLKEDEVAGILYVGDTISLKVKGTGFDESILKSILDQYTSTAATVKEIAKTNPSKINDAIAALRTSVAANQEITLSKQNNTDTMASYFYALIAMACLFDSFLGFKATISTQANLTALAARRTVTPVHKLKLILSDFLACLLIAYTNMCILICYLAFPLNVNFGNRLPFVFLTTLAGCIFGISFGIFITSLGKWSIPIKISIMISVQMIFCFFSGLMFNNMMDVIEKYCPIFNQINPASLISDAIYSLSIYDSYHRFFMNLGILIFMTILMTGASFFITRRERYASI